MEQKCLVHGLEGLKVQVQTSHLRSAFHHMKGGNITHSRDSNRFGVTPSSVSVHITHTQHTSINPFGGWKVIAPEPTSTSLCTYPLHPHLPTSFHLLSCQLSQFQINLPTRDLPETTMAPNPCCRKSTVFTWRSFEKQILRSLMTLILSLMHEKGVAQILLCNKTIINLNFICKYKFQDKFFAKINK